MESTYVLHCQSSALNNPLLFSASCLPSSKPPIFTFPELRCWGFSVKSSKIGQLQCSSQLTSSHQECQSFIQYDSWILARSNGSQKYRIDIWRFWRNLHQITSSPWFSVNYISHKLAFNCSSNRHKHAASNNFINHDILMSVNKQ